MAQIRQVDTIFPSKPTIEGAGVHLKRVFGYNEIPGFDPFLLLDAFHSDDPADYIAGFPWHPHRGIETITYMLQGQIKHEDSLGNKGIINPGEVQWMTAGSGIIHSEMPQSQPIWGFQLWANLPHQHKMMPPRYREITQEQIPIIEQDSSTKIRLISGEINGVKGPVQDIVTNPEYLDISVTAETTFLHPVNPTHTVFAYLIQGHARFGSENGSLINAEHAVLLSRGDQIQITAGEQGTRLLLISGTPIREPIAWRGPIVMNTQEELQTAFHELNEETFLKHQ
jgi:redox-sensitive bicupin YhaK (pirin superfamily)